MEKAFEMDNLMSNPAFVDIVKTENFSETQGVDLTDVNVKRVNTDNVHNNSHSHSHKMGMSSETFVPLNLSTVDDQTIFQTGSGDGNLSGGRAFFSLSIVNFRSIPQIANTSGTFVLLDIVDFQHIPITGNLPGVFTPLSGLTNVNFPNITTTGNVSSSFAAVNFENISQSGNSFGDAVLLKKALTTGTSLDRGKVSRHGNRDDQIETSDDDSFPSGQLGSLVNTALVRDGQVSGICTANVTDATEVSFKDGKSKEKISRVNYSKRFPGLLNSRRNNAIYGKKKTHKCNICDKTFCAFSKLRRHMTTHERGRTPIRRKVAVSEFGSSKPQNATDVDSGRKHKCDICNKMCLTLYHLRRHVRSHTGEKPYKCSFCEKTFCDSTPLKNHIKTHTGEKDNQCLTCGKILCNKISLQRHTRIHTGEKPFQCPTCGKKFSDDSYFQQHVKTHSDLRPYECLVCSRAFSTNKRLTLHMRLHTGDKPYQCSSCGKRFCENSALQKHIRTHIMKNPNECKICGEVFPNTDEKKQHMKTHEEQQKYICTICDFLCGSKSSLQLHTRSHTGEKPYSCSVCGKAFRRKGTLKIHERIHSGEKPYACTACGMSFCYNDSLNKHMKTHE